ncbi:MAG: tyrosine-type recombinase/integrase [Solirubrobacteraceae bacterium]
MRVRASTEVLFRVRCDNRSTRFTGLSSPLTDSNRRPLLTIERRRGKRGQTREAATTKVDQTKGIQTGLRPSELFALERGDLDRAAGVVQIRRAYANGRVKQTKTRLSRRAVPLQAIALEALDQLPRHGESALLFPNSRGGHLDFRNFNRRHWKPVQRAVGIEPLRDLYDLRHTYATFALRAGVPVFALSRFMGTSIAMIDLHYGHLASDSYQHAVSLLDALALERAVDAGWTPAPKPATPHGDTVSKPRESVPRRAVDAGWTSKPRQVATAAGGRG